MAKQKPSAIKAECKQHPAAVLYVTVKPSMAEKKRQGVLKQNCPLTPSRMIWDPGPDDLYTKLVHGDGGATDFPGQCPLSKGCKIRPALLALNYQTV